MNGMFQRRYGTIGVLLLAAALASPLGSAGQAPAPPPSPLPLAMAASAGSFAGLALGATFGVQSGLGGDGEDSLVGAVLLASAGAILGTTVGMKLAAYQEMSATKALGASLVGFGSGLVVSYALADATRGTMAVPVVFSVSQGVVAAVVASLRR